MSARASRSRGESNRVEFKDPHTWIVLRLDDGTAYTVDWAPLSRLTSERHHRPRERIAGVWSARRRDGQSNKARGRDTGAFPGVHEQRESEHRRPDFDTARRRQFQLGAASENEPSELASRLLLTKVHDGWWSGVSPLCRKAHSRCCCCYRFRWAHSGSTGQRRGFPWTADGKRPGCVRTQDARWQAGLVGPVAASSQPVSLRPHTRFAG